MISLKRPSLHESVGVTLYIIGIVLGDFIILRPNRIEGGQGYPFVTALGSGWYLAAALFVMAFYVFIKLVQWGPDRQPKGNGRTLIKILLVGWLVGMLVWFTGALAYGSQSLLANQPEAARASIGLGYFLGLVGLILLLYRDLLLLDRPWVNLITVFLVIGIFWGAYKGGQLEAISLIRELYNKESRLMDELIRHMQLSLSASLTGLCLSLYLGTTAYVHPSRTRMVMGIVNMAQVIPTLTFLGLIMIPLTALSKVFPILKDFGVSGIGFLPAYLVLTMYALLPITTNVIAGYRSLDSSIQEAARGMGMTRRQIRYKIELPLIVPYIYTGYQTALVQTVGNAILAGLVGGGGLGAILFLGLAQSAPDLVILSALVVVVIAFTLKTILTGLLNLVMNQRKGDLE